MAKRELPEVQALFDRIAACQARAASVDAVVVRSVDVRYASQRDFLSGAGAAAMGGRWNPVGMSAVYASLDIVTAVKEAYQNFLDYGFPPSSIRPRVIAGAHVHLQCLLDLTSASVRRKVGFTSTELVEEDWQSIQAEGDESWTQAIGRGCREAGFEGLLVPSARDRRRGKNLVLFPNQLRPGSRVELLGRDELPPHPDDWPA